MADAGEGGGATVVFNVVPKRPRTEVIDYDTKRGQIHFKDATAKLHETLYDFEPDGFYQFMKHLKIRAKTFGWSDAKGKLRITSPRAYLTIMVHSAMRLFWPKN
mgnify:CR=1 FL=1